MTQKRRGIKYREYSRFCNLYISISWLKCGLMIGYKISKMKKDGKQ